MSALTTDRATYGAGYGLGKRAIADRFESPPEEWDRPAPSESDIRERADALLNDPAHYQMLLEESGRSLVMRRAVRRVVERRQAGKPLSRDEILIAVAMCNVALDIAEQELNG